jgi:hypothetical protein
VISRGRVSGWLALPPILREAKEMRVNSFVTRRVHIYLGASEQFLMEEVPRYQEKDTKRKASIREIEVVESRDENLDLIYRVMARGKAVKSDGSFGTTDRTFEFTGLDSFPEDIRNEIENLFRRQRSGSENESYSVARENGPTGLGSIPLPPSEIFS